MFEQRKTIKKTRNKKINSLRVVLFGQLREEIIEKKSVKNIHVKKKKNEINLILLPWKLGFLKTTLLVRMI